MSIIPKNLLKFGEFKSHKDEYVNHYLNHKPNKIESVWLDFDNFKNYIAHIEELSKNNSIDISGLRIHMIAENSRVNIAIVPTVEINNRHKCFDPGMSGKNNPALLEDILNDRNNDSVDSTGILNRCNPCPPICDK